MNTNNEHHTLEPRAVTAGTPRYYLERLDDFELRNSGAQPPSYYADYGNKCLQQFLVARRSLSSRGQQWVDDTMMLLQEMMEHERSRDPTQFADLERVDDAFRDFAFGTHSRAYYQAGVFDLGLRDLWKIARTPDLQDLLSDDGLKEVVQVVLGFDGGSDVAGNTDDLPLDGTGVLGTVARLTGRARSTAQRLLRRGR